MADGIVAFAIGIGVAYTVLAGFAVWARWQERHTTDYSVEGGLATSTHRDSVPLD